MDFPYIQAPPVRSANLIDTTVSMSLHFCRLVRACAFLPVWVSVCARSSRDETRLSAAFSDCTHERSQNNNKEPSVGRMKALSPTISAQRVSSPTVSLSDTSHITWRQEGETVSHIWPQQIFPYVNEIVAGFLWGPNAFWLCAEWWWSLLFHVWRSCIW